MRQVRGFDATTRIGHPEQHLAVQRTGANRDQPVGVSELDGITDEILEDLQ